MRILILSQWYPPEPMKQLSDMAETLQSLGHEVTVLTGFPNWPTGKLYPGYRMKLWQKETLNGVPVVRIPLYPDHSSSKLKRIFNFLSFVVTASILGAWLVKKPDVIHVIQPPTTCFPAWFLSRLWKIPFTYEVQDMWPETLLATNMIHNRKVLDLVGKYCDWVYTKAAAIRVISKGFKADLINKGVPTDKIYLISNWVDIDFYKPQAPSNELIKNFALDGFFIFMYAGTIGLAQGLDTVLDAASQLQEFSKVKFVLIGDGVEMGRLQEVASSRNLNNVIFLGRYPMDEMPKLYALSDVLLLHLKDDPLFRITIPHKVLTYMSTGKPVLAGLEGDTADIVSDAEAGLVCPSSNPEALAKAVKQFLELSVAERNKMGENGRDVAVRSYSREILVPQIERMLMDAVEVYKCH